MSDPEIIKSSSPHRVSIPEGSSNAVGKKAEVGESSIRKVLNDASGETNEITKNEDELKGKKTPLSLDEEIALAKEEADLPKNNWNQHMAHEIFHSMPWLIGYQGQKGNCK